MDTKTLISDAKARFAHNSAKVYLKEKYESKLIIAEQGGLWKADANTITILTALSNQFETTTVLIDTFDNPVEIDATALLETLTTTYKNVMTEWYAEWQELENKR